jgi:hypothetical protein
MTSAAINSIPPAFAGFPAQFAKSSDTQSNAFASMLAGILNDSNRPSASDRNASSDYSTLANSTSAVAIAPTIVAFAPLSSPSTADSTFMKTNVVSAQVLADTMRDHWVQAASAGRTTLHLQFNSPELGRLDVHLNATALGASAVVIVGDDGRQPQLATLMPELIARLRASGITIRQAINASDEAESASEPATWLAQPARIRRRLRLDSDV